MFKMLIVLFATVGLSSCGTVAGFGDDIKSVAEWSEDYISDTNEESVEETLDNNPEPTEESI